MKLTMFSKMAIVAVVVGVGAFTADYNYISHFNERGRKNHGTS